MTYIEFIDSCKDKEINHERSQYHHIIPICMGGPKTQSNVIELSWEDHWMAHQLLFRENPDNEKLRIAASKSLEAWIHVCEEVSKQKGTNHPMYGRRHSEESKEKTSQTMMGHKLSDETREKISKALKGKKIGERRPSHWKLVDGKRVYY